MSRFIVSSVALSLALSCGLAPPATAQDAYGQYPPQRYSPAPFSQQELDGLLAPIALYPDDLLAQVLMAATYPQDVVQAARFMHDNRGLTGDALDEAVASWNWDASVQSLAGFPQVLDMMSQRMDWTRRLGEAYLADQQWVMDTIQELRWRAQEAGNLASTPQQVVRVEDRTVYIEPAQPDVVYVPTYNPQVIYGPWWAPAFVPYYWRPPRVYYPGVVVAPSRVVFGVGYRVTPNHWYWARPDWHGRTIVVDANRGNRFVERHPYYRDWARDGWWQRRRETSNADMARLRQQYRAPQGASMPGNAGAARRLERDLHDQRTPGQRFSPGGQAIAPGVMSGGPEAGSPPAGSGGPRAGAPPMARQPRSGPPEPGEGRARSGEQGRNRGGEDGRGRGGPPPQVPPPQTPAPQGVAPHGVAPQPSAGQLIAPQPPRGRPPPQGNGQQAPLAPPEHRGVRGPQAPGAPSAPAAAPPPAAPRNAVPVPPPLAPQSSGPGQGPDRQAQAHGPDRQGQGPGPERQAQGHGPERQAQGQGPERQAQAHGPERQAQEGGRHGGERARPE